MDTEDIKSDLLKYVSNENVLIRKNLFNSTVLDIYAKSIIEKQDVLFFIAKDGLNKNLYLIYDVERDSRLTQAFTGEEFKVNGSLYTIIKKCELSTQNRKAIQQYFEFTQPKLLGLVNSFGFGDRIGLANAAHIRSLAKSEFKAILAQQSIRELTRTNRTPAEVMDAAVWAVFQEGYKYGFGADADHLKTTDDIDLMVESGFKMFTFDPGEFVHNEADKIETQLLNKAIKKINWAGLNIEQKILVDKYANKKFNISKDLQIEADETQVKRAVLKYGDALAHIKKMYDHLKTKYSSYESEVEVSVDETESVTSPFEHYFIVNELVRLDVKLISLAPRFVGSFEKGIDYKGDLNLFRSEYLKHIQIVKHFGFYKISLHSGSDKFSVYKIIGEIDNSITHIKTAGTSYLEALKVAAIKQPELFREILDYSLSLYETEKKSYHVSADISKLKSAIEYSSDELVQLFNNNDCRQVLHVTFGRILTDKNKQGEFVFKQKLLNCLKQYEDVHYEILINHFNKHLEPFKRV
ncbi:MAG: hypothetical protein HXY50_07690 [Ignavibacteriaceae bacterium]|nr:hypothetical protein [Ignavibacteriaceae bacterium]